MIRDERTGWRDEKISNRHREWGFNCPMVDIDFLCVEYDSSQPKILVEYKHENANMDFNRLKPDGAAPHSYKALKRLADASEIPFIVVVYPSEFEWFRVHPMNSYAQKYVSETKVYSELRYIALLYEMRGRAVPDDVLKNIYEKYYKHLTISLGAFMK